MPRVETSSRTPTLIIYPSQQSLTKLLLLFLLFPLFFLLFPLFGYRRRSAHLPPFVSCSCHDGAEVLQGTAEDRPKMKAFKRWRW
jgi:hypothetical protein